MNDIVMAGGPIERRAEKLKSSLTQIESDDIEKVVTIISAIKANPNAVNFLFPVDTKIYPDYLKAINDKPMDISSIEAKMAGRKYHFIQDIFDDFQLIWDNCRIYNKEGFDIYNQAEKMEEATVLSFEKYYVIQKGEKKNYVHEFDSNIYDEEAFNDPNYYKENPIPIDPYYMHLKEKLELSRTFKTLSSSQLTSLINNASDQLKAFIVYEKDNEMRILIEQMTIDDLNHLSQALVIAKKTQELLPKPISITPSNPLEPQVSITSLPPQNDNDISM